ncbi:MAG TPA: ATP-binding protein [Thermoanaerobaculia bacterium]|jgi:signal transduction histidine kinase
MPSVTRYDTAASARRSPVDIPPRLAHELSRILNESLSNAARHGGASHAAVLLDLRDDVVHLRVSDNGRGFPFTGRYDLRALEQSGNGPRTLKERVTTLGGSLLVESSPAGAIVDACFPVRQGAAG